MSQLWRPAHRLKGEKSLAMPRHVVFFDTETRMTTLADGSVEHRLRLGWACYWRRGSDRHLAREEWHAFKSVGSFWRWLFSHTQDKVKLWVLARNVTFDFTVCEGWKHLRAAGYKLKFFYSAGVVTILSVKRGKSSIVFLDSMNWFPESLRATGERIGIKKGDVDFDNVTDSALSAYCKNDVLIEKHHFQDFVTFLESNSLARLCYTRGSTAMSAFLFRHYQTPIWIHNNREAIDLERDAYKGGRVECFHIGHLTRGPYYVVDVNSLYPYCMRSFTYPTKYLRKHRRVSLSTLRKLLSKRAVVANVLIKTDEPAYAVRRQRTVFPVGRFRVTLCTPELEYAMSHGHIESVGSTVVYERHPVFTGFVDAFYSLRQEFKSRGVAEYEQFCKYMLNSLYGKFGQKAEKWEKIADCPDEPDRTEFLIYVDRPGMRKLRYLMGQCFELVSYGEAFDSFPGIAAHVTAYGRMVLWSLMQKAGAGHYFYCDTDSLMLDAVGLDRLAGDLSDTVLGKLKVEETTDAIELRGLKDYSTSCKVVTKGIRKSAVEIRKGVFRQEQWPSLTGLLRQPHGQPYTVKQITKHLDRTYTKGEVTKCGDVRPFVFDVLS